MAYKHKIEKQPGVTIHRLASDIDPHEVISEVKKEAERRIFSFLGVDEMSAALMKEVNAITDPQPGLIEMVKAIRDASNNLEDLIPNMSERELDTFDVSNWDGWPDAG